MLTNFQRVRSDGDFHVTRCRVIGSTSRSKLHQRRCTNINCNCGCTGCRDCKIILKRSGVWLRISLNCLTTIHVTLERQRMRSDGNCIRGSQRVRTNGQNHVAIIRCIGSTSRSKLYKCCTSIICGRIVEVVYTVVTESTRRHDLIVEKVVDCFICKISCLSKCSKCFCLFSYNTIADECCALEVRLSEVNDIFVTTASNVLNKSINKETNISAALSFVSVVV